MFSHTRIHSLICFKTFYGQNTCTCIQHPFVQLHYLVLQKQAANYYQARQYLIINGSLVSANRLSHTQ